MKRPELVAKIGRHLVEGSVEVYRLLSLVLIGAGVGAQVLVDRLDKGWSLAIAIGALIAISVGIWWLGERRAASIENSVLAARAEAMLDVGHSLAPLARELARVATLSTAARRLQREALRRAVVNAATGLSRTTRLRANYFELSPNQNSLDCKTTTGRSEGPKGGFRRGEKSGDTAIDMVLAGKTRFCRDTVNEPPPGWEPSNNGLYLTFISVAVGAPGKPFGMLTLDAPNVGDLTQEDVNVMIVLGHLLGLAEQITE